MLENGIVLEDFESLEADVITADELQRLIAEDEASNRGISFFLENLGLNQHEDIFQGLMQLYAVYSIRSQAGNANTMEEERATEDVEGSESGANDIGKIADIPKGNRPDPTTYLDQEYIDEHLSNFQG